MHMSGDEVLLRVCAGLLGKEFKVLGLSKCRCQRWIFGSAGHDVSKLGSECQPCAGFSR